MLTKWKDINKIGSMLDGLKESEVLSRFSMHLFAPIDNIYWRIYEETDPIRDGVEEIYHD